MIPCSSSKTTSFASNMCPSAVICPIVLSACRCKLHNATWRQFVWPTTMDSFRRNIAEELFRKHHLLGYSMRYWTAHFRASPGFDAGGANEFSPNFRQMCNFWGVLFLCHCCPELYGQHIMIQCSRVMEWAILTPKRAKPFPDSASLFE